MIEFFNFNKENGVASFYDNHITINKPMLKYCNDTYRVRVGNDKSNAKVYFFLYNKDKSLSGEVDENTLVKPSFSKTYLRLCSKPLLEYLSSKYELTVLTNWETTCQINRLKTVGIYKYFKNVYGGEKLKKPDTKAFMKAIEPYDVSECVMVGDSLHFDIEPAIKLGMKTYMIGKDIKTILDLKEML